MKRSLFSALALAAVLFQPASLHAGMTVHEWGTMTVLVGSDGQPVRWYQPHLDQAGLPPFVHQSTPLVTGKTGTGTWRRTDGSFVSTSNDGALVRMETPVLYFYPEAETQVQVAASFPSGGLSEWFPEAFCRNDHLFVNSFMCTGLQWKGRLLPPNHPLAEKIPHASGEAGRRYEAARNVPDAWLFESLLAPAPGTVKSTTPQVDRMIFYRGAGDLTLPLHVSASDDRNYWVTNYGPDPMPVIFAVRASNTGIAWNRVEGLAGQTDKHTAVTRTTLPAASEVQGGSILALRKAMAEALTAQGLTPQESAAMVTTWGDLWFGENGTRFLAILPQPWVGLNVPLQISPTPSSLARIYVARMEILTKEREDALLAVLTEKDTDKTAPRKLKELGFGRFTQGALRRVKDLESRNLEIRLNELTRTN